MKSVSHCYNMLFLLKQIIIPDLDPASHAWYLRKKYIQSDSFNVRYSLYQKNIVILFKFLLVDNIRFLF